MAVIKHISIKNSNYDAAVDYLTLKHDEFTNKPILDENGNKIPRDEFLIEGIGCDPFTFGRECEATNALFHKNPNREDIKAHHYIISFDPRDRDENGLTSERAQALAMNFARKNFPGHQIIVCTHPDGHNSAGNIHVHIVFNSVRKTDVPMQDFMEREGDSHAGNKHHVTKQLLEYLKQETMSMCQEESLYQVDLLSPAKVRITDREYWAKRKGQAKLDEENKEKAAKGIAPEQTIYKTDKDFLRDAIHAVLSDSVTFESFVKKLFEQYGIADHESRGAIGYVPPGKEKAIRGKRLGTDFEKKHIEEVIAENAERIRTGYEESKDDESIPTGADNHHEKYQSSGIRLIVDLENCIKAQQNQYYARKVKIGNLKQMANTLAFLQTNGIGSVEELSQLLTSTYEDFSEKQKALKFTESRLREVNLLIKNTGQYLGNKDVYKEYLASKDKKNFRESHRAELTLYEAARDYLKEHAPRQETSDGKIRFRTPSIKSLRAEKEKLTALKNQQYEDFSYVRAKYRELQTVANNVNQMLDLEHPIHKDLQQERQSEPQMPQQKTKSSHQQKETGQSL